MRRKSKLKQAKKSEPLPISPWCQCSDCYTRKVMACNPPKEEMMFFTQCPKCNKDIGKKIWESPIRLYVSKEGEIIFNCPSCKLTVSLGLNPTANNMITYLLPKGRGEPLCETEFSGSDALYKVKKGDIF